MPTRIYRRTLPVLYFRKTKYVIYQARFQQVYQYYSMRFLMIKISLLGDDNLPCSPSPCGPYSICRVQSDRAVCSCSPGFRGTPPTCRPECLVSSECSPHLACIGQKCSDPCLNACGLNAHCVVSNHNPICSCPKGFTGDPFSQCTREGKYMSSWC